ncbi:MAG TPA: DUF4258 domain-containing protein [Chloroflexota bacterium]
MEISRHAKNKLRHLKVTAEEIGNALARPDSKLVGPDGKPNALATVRDMLLHIVYVVENDDVVVVTVWREK